MSRRSKEFGEQGEATREFVHKYWPLAVVATATAVGAAVWLTARYLRSKKQREEHVEANLKQAQREATIPLDDTAMLLEVGAYLPTIVPAAEVYDATTAIGEHLDDEDGRNALTTLGQIAVNDTGEK